MAPPQSVDFVTEFIEISRRYPCLWKIKSAEYANKHLREKAFEKLIEFCQTVVPDANKEYVTKKINNLRSSFRKELNKVRDSTRSGMGADEAYVPKLWYYKLLLFTADQEESRETVENIVDEDEITQADETQDSSASMISGTPEDNVIQNTETEALNPISPPSTKKHRKILPNLTSTKSKNKTQIKDDFYKEALNTLSKTDDEYDHFGLCTAAKLRRMDSQQRIFCENLINMAVYKGTLGCLNEHYTIQSQIPSTL